MPSITSRIMVNEEVEIREETFEGKEYLVAPVVAIVEGVLNGALVPADEIGRHPASWSGIPLPIDHPRDERGEPITANDPDIIDNRVIGRFFNASFEDDRLKGEIWIDVEKAEEMGGDAEEVLDKLNNQGQLEVSTAYFHDIEDEQGEFDGKNYEAIHRNLKPDHLALLPGNTGACSWEDGCGAPRVNCQTGEVRGGEQLPDNDENVEPQGNMDKVKDWFKGMATALGFNVEVSDGDKREMLMQALQDKEPENTFLWIMDVFESFVVYEKGNKLYRQPYNMSDEQVELVGEPEEVVKVTEYKPRKKQSEEGSSVTNNERKDLIGRLAANENLPLTEEELQNKEDEELQALCQLVSCADEEGEQDTDEEQEEQETQLEGEGQEEEQEEEEDTEEEEEVDEELAELSKAIKEAGGVSAFTEMVKEFKSQKKQEEEQHSNLVKKLANNDNCDFEEEELKELSLNHLKKLDKHFTVADYSGIGGPRTHSGNNGEEVPEPPTILRRGRKED